MPQIPVALYVIAAILAALVIAVEFVLGANSFTGWIGRNIPNPKNAPFVMGFVLFAVFTALFARAFQRQEKLAESGDQSVWILWVCAAIFATTAYWFATTSGGKV